MSLRYDPLTTVAIVACPLCLAGNPLLGCVLTRLSSVASMPQMTFAMVPDAAWQDSDQWPWRTAPAIGPVGRLGRHSASNPGGCRQLGLVPLLPSVHVCVRCPGPLGACSEVCALCAVPVCCWWLRPSPPPNLFLLFLCICLVVLCFFVLFFV